jgi:GGDEF domain-containing protein
MAITDELNGAFNRHRFMERISEEAARSGRSAIASSPVIRNGITWLYR